MGIDRDVLTKVYDVLTGGSVDDFEDWFVGRTWSSERTALVASVTHLLVQRDVLTDAEILQELRELASTIVVKGPIETGAANVTHHAVLVGR